MHVVNVPLPNRNLIRATVLLHYELSAAFGCSWTNRIGIGSESAMKIGIFIAIDSAGNGPTYHVNKDKDRRW